MLVRGHEFAMSSMLTPNRAQVLYERFLDALALPGDVAEFGVYRGETALALLAHVPHGKTLHLFDTFAGLPALTPEDEPERPGSPHGGGPHVYGTSTDIVRASLDGHGSFRLYAGEIGTFTGTFDASLCFAHVDADLYAGTRDALAICRRRVVPGGIVVVDDYDTSWVGVKKAVDEKLSAREWDVERYEGQAVAWRREQSC